MGNCLVQQKNLIKIKKTDGKFLEYNEPMKVYQVLSDFSGYAISETLPVLQYLRPDTKLLHNHQYYLVPHPSPSREASKKKVRFSIPEPEADAEKGSGVMRIKLVITKQELQEMLQNGVLSAKATVSQIEIEKNRDTDHIFNEDDDCRGWRPVLESIAEVN